MKQQTKDPKWPFPVSYPATKPVPWSKQQIKEYNQQQQAKPPCKSWLLRSNLNGASAPKKEKTWKK